VLFETRYEGMSMTRILCE